LLCSKCWRWAQPQRQPRLSSSLLKRPLVPQQMASADVQVVTQALRGLDDRPEGLRQMLVEGLPFAVIPADGEQHRYLAEVQAMIRDELSRAHRAAAERAAQCQAEVLGSQAKHKELEEAVAAAAAAEESSKAEVARTADELRNAEVQSEYEDRMCMTAKTTEEALSNDDAALREARGEAAGLRDGALRALSDGAWRDDAEKEEQIAAVQAYLRSIRAEPALVAAAPGALGRAPGSRAAFDGTTVDAIGKTIESRLACIDADLAAGVPALKEAHAEALGGWAICELARERVSDAQAELSRAKEQLSELTDALRAAEEKVRSSLREQSDLLVAEVLAGDSVSSLANAIDVFSRLVANANALANPASLEADSAALEADAEMQEATSVAPTSCAAAAAEAQVKQISMNGAAARHVVEWRIGGLSSGEMAVANAPMGA